MGLSSESAEELVRDLLELQRATRRVVKQSSVQRELTTSQLTVLTFLASVPGCRAKDLVAGSSLGPSGMSRHLAALEQLGHVARTPDPEDGRAQRVAITAAGRRALETNLRQDAEQLVTRLAGLGEDEARDTARRLRRLTDLLTSSLDADDEQPGTAPSAPSPHGTATDTHA